MNTIRQELIIQQMLDTLKQIRQTPHVWQVGDLIDHPQQGTSLLLAIREDKPTIRLFFLSETGTQYEQTGQMVHPFFWYNTGLNYTYQSKNQVQLDYINDFFGPFFLV